MGDRKEVWIQKCQLVYLRGEGGWIPASTVTNFFLGILKGDHFHGFYTNDLKILTISNTHNPLNSTSILVCSLPFSNQSMDLLINNFKINILLATCIKARTFQSSMKSLFSMVYQCRVGTTGKETVPTSFIRFMNINKQICHHRSQKTKCCVNRTKL